VGVGINLLKTALIILPLIPLGLALNSGAAITS
jgi:hypothetical protein